MTTTIVLEPPAPFLNANDRLHWREKAKRVKAWRNSARLAALEVEPYMYDRAHVTCAIRFPDNKRRDVGNWFVTAKACLDGIVQAGEHLRDDSDEYVLGPDMRRHVPNGTPLVTITIRSLEDS